MSNNGYNANNEREPIKPTIRKRDSPQVRLTMENGRGLTRQQLYNNRNRYGLRGHFKGEPFVPGVSGGSRKRGRGRKVSKKTRRRA
jgi:hypothetical protein